MPLQPINLAILALAFSISVTGNVLACACCADPGERSLHSVPLAGHPAEMLSGIELAPLAHLFTTDCYQDCIDGIDPLEDSYTIDLHRTAAAWTFHLTGRELGSKGTLRLQLPRDISIFRVDQSPGAVRASPVLYKEWRLSGALAGTGAFGQARSLNTQAELVLQGRGNLCDFAGQMTHWTLTVRGPHTSFRLYGRLREIP